MKKLSFLFIFILVLNACSSPEITAPEITWERTNFLQEMDTDVQNVTDVLIAEDGRVMATFYDGKHMNYIAITDDDGESWEKIELRGMSNPRALRQLSDGSFIIGATGLSDFPLIYTSENGIKWDALETTGEQLPNPFAASVWDILELPNGSLLIATDSQENDAEKLNPALYLLEDNHLSLMEEFYGLGVLALEIDQEGTLYLATQESDEHDDPNLAGQAHIWRSTDMGDSWEEVAEPTGANRVYDILAASDGSLYLGTGISGNFYRSTDKGDSWEQMTHVPTTDKLRGNPPAPQATDASRIYQMIELDNGMILVGTGNKTGSIFLTPDRGESWLETSDTGNNIVTWGLAQDPKSGTLWAGTGSYGGDVLTASVE